MKDEMQYNFRLTVMGDTLVNVEMTNADGEWRQAPGFFSVADMLRAASDAVLERISDDLRGGAS